MPVSAPLILALLIFGRTTFALVEGSASNDLLRYRREDTPAIFWFTIIAGYACVVGLLAYAAFSAQSH